MADLSDVEQALVQLAASFLQVEVPYLPGSIVFSDAVQGKVRIFRGWPSAPQLDADLAAGITDVSVYPIAGMVRDNQRYFYRWFTTPTEPTLSATVNGATVSFTGIAKIGHVVGVMIGEGPGAPAYAYRLEANDSLTSVAAAVAALIPGATASGQSVVLASGAIGNLAVGMGGVAQTNPKITARVAIDQPAWLETRQQEQGIWVMVWSPTAGARDLAASAIDGGFAGMQDQWGRMTQFFGLPDGSNAQVIYAGSYSDDTPQRVNLFRRNLRYNVRYFTTLLQQQPEVIFTGGTLNEVTEFGAVLEN